MINYFLNAILVLSCLVVLTLSLFWLFNVGVEGVSFKAVIEVWSPLTIVVCAMSSKDIESEISDEYDDSERDASESDSFSDSIWDAVVLVLEFSFSIEEADEEDVDISSEVDEVLFNEASLIKLFNMRL